MLLFKIKIKVTNVEQIYKISCSTILNRSITNAAQKVGYRNRRVSGTNNARARPRSSASQDAQHQFVHYVMKILNPPNFPFHNTQLLYIKSQFNV